MVSETRFYEDTPLRQQARQARQAVASGALRGAPLLELLLSVPYRHRDRWTDDFLGLEEPPPDVANLPRGCVPYLPCGVDEILTVVRDVPLAPHSTLVDLGSGLGRVVILAHLLCGARAQGIEIQGPLVHQARAHCAALGLTDVSFMHANAADVDLDGSVFFLYAPFNGAMFAAVLRRLEAAARRRPIVVCAVAVDLQGFSWLRPRRPSTSTVSLYDSCSPR